MVRSREHVHGAGSHGGVACLRKALDVARQRGAVAGNVYHALRLHPCDGRDDLRCQSPARRIDGHDVRAQPFARQLCRDIARVAAEKLRVRDAVARGIVLRVPDRLRHDLRADHPSGVLCHGERDRAHTAVKIEHRLPARELCKLDRLAVKPFALRTVDLIERRHAQAERKTAKRVLQPVCAPKRTVAVAEDDVAFRGIRAEHDADRFWARLAQHGDKLPLVRKLLCVDKNADKALPLRVGAHIEVPEQSRSASFLVAGNGIFC